MNKIKKLRSSLKLSEACWRTPWAAIIKWNMERKIGFQTSYISYISMVWIMLPIIHTLVRTPLDILRNLDQKTVSDKLVGCVYPGWPLVRDKVGKNEEICATRGGNIPVNSNWAYERWCVLETWTSATYDVRCSLVADQRRARWRVSFVCNLLAAC